MVGARHDPETGLTPMQWKFVRAICDKPDESATNIAMSIGCPAASAATTAHGWLIMPKVQEAIRLRKEELSVAASITEEWWLQRHREIAGVDPRDFYDEQGFPRPLAEIPAASRKAIKRIRSVELFDGKGDQRHVNGIVRDYDFIDIHKSMDALERHGGWGKTINVHQNPDGSPIMPGCIEVVFKQPEAKKDEHTEDGGEQAED